MNQNKDMKTNLGAPFKPAWWLIGPHFQTLYPALFRKNSIPEEYWRERLETPDHDFLDLDFCGKGTGSLVILLHGLTGSSRSGYIVGLQKKLLSQGFRSVALNFRGCSGESNRLARCYHSGETEDIQFLYQTLRQREPHTLMAAVGFSLGGNVLLKWLGEQENKLSLFAAVAVSVPLLLNVCADKLDRGFARIYRFNLLRELIHYMNAKINALSQAGNFKEVSKLKKLGDLSTIQSFWEYDDRVVAKLHGFKNVHDYYRRSSSRQFLKQISIPTLIIQAQDDPFMTALVLPEQHELAACVNVEVSKAGGHVGFIAGRNPLKPRYWLEERIPMFLTASLSRT